MTTQSPGQEPNKVVARRLAEEVFSQGNMRTFDEILAANYVNHNMPVPGIPGTKEGFKQIVAATRQAFPDVHVNVKDVVAEGDWDQQAEPYLRRSRLRVRFRTCGRW